MPHEAAASTSRLRGGSALARQLRGVWRLSRATLHILLGLFIAATTFGRIDAAARTRRIQWWSARALHLLGVRVEVLGTPRPGAKLLVANHVSWLDIMAINAAVPARFVSKSEVRHWPLLGRLASQSGTLFIERQRPRDALRVVHTMAEALQAGDTLAVFPEGTTSDGRALLTFHANLLQCAIAVAAPVQPLALRYSDERDAISPAPVYVGDTTLLQSAWSVVCAQGLSVRVNVLPALAVTHADRRRLAERLRAEIEAGLAFDAGA
jgi:1-acyl-sn-glycerol-3-phosphate acyltransferase